MCAQLTITENFQKYDNYYRMGSLTPTTNTAVQIPKQSAREDDTPVTEKTLVMTGILQLAAMALDKLSQGAGYALMRGKEFTSAKNVKHIADGILKKNELNVVTKYINKSNMGQVAKTYRLPLEALIPVAKGQNAFYHDGLKLAVAPAAKPSLMLHELGHACNAKNSVLKLLQSSRAIAFAAPAALLFLNRLAPQKSSDKPNFLERNAGKLGFLAFLPTIIEEGVASLRGVKAAKAAQEALGKFDLSALKRNYFFAWSTYLLAGIGLGLASRMAFLREKHSNGNG